MEGEREKEGRKEKKKKPEMHVTEKRPWTNFKPRTETSEESNPTDA
jgi:hypothetical protein